MGRSIINDYARLGYEIELTVTARGFHAVVSHAGIRSLVEYPAGPGQVVRDSDLRAVIERGIAVIEAAGA